MLCRIEFLRREVLELAKAFDAGIDRALEGAHRHFKGVAGVEHQRVGIRYQRVPVGCIHIGAHTPRGIDAGIAERDDLLFQPHLRRWNGMASAVEYFSSRWSSRPPNRSPCCSASAKAAMPSSLPASEPLMPSWASSTLPFRPSAAHSARRGSRSARKSGSAANW